MDDTQMDPMAPAMEPEMTPEEAPAMPAEEAAA